jgi:hypothetical protein
MRYILLPSRLLDTNYRFMSHARPMGFSTRLLDLANLHKIFCGVSSVILWCLVCVVALHTYINCQLLSISYMNPRYVYSCRVMKPKNYTWIQPYPIGVMRNMSQSSYDATTILLLPMPLPPIGSVSSSWEEEHRTKVIINHTF